VWSRTFFPLPLFFILFGHFAVFQGDQLFPESHNHHPRRYIFSSRYPVFIAFTEVLIGTKMIVLFKIARIADSNYIVWIIHFPAYIFFVGEMTGFSINPFHTLVVTFSAIFPGW
jgi:hypothetical protein